MIDSVSNIKEQALNNVEQIVPEPDEQAAMEAYKNGNPHHRLNKILQKRADKF